MNFEIKRLELVLRGMADLVKKQNKDSNLKLLVVGKGKERRYLRMAREMGIVDRVIFAGVTQKVEDYYLASDIFAMPSRFDTFGLAVLEAMMAGLPVIITQRVGARDLVNSDVQGFVLSEDPSPGDVAEKLAVLMDKENRRRMGENARELALQHTWNRTVDQVEEIYQFLARERTIN
jgi:UDP-glucose:(heptosyl)LPS alpha-1,3-glucosyltransferase